MVVRVDLYGLVVEQDCLLEQLNGEPLLSFLISFAV
jgi:hypothetical protein